MLIWETRVSKSDLLLACSKDGIFLSCTWIQNLQLYAGCLIDSYSVSALFVPGFAERLESWKKVSFRVLLLESCLVKKQIYLGAFGHTFMVVTFFLFKNSLIACDLQGPCLGLLRRILRSETRLSLGPFPLKMFGNEILNWSKNAEASCILMPEIFNSTLNILYENHKIQKPYRDP